jgi:hypothetical protein
VSTLVAAALVAAGASIIPAPAMASSVNSAAFSGGSGTVSVGGTLYAKDGGALTLTVNTSSDTKCVDVTGVFTGHQTSSTARSTWTFSSLTATTGDGVQSVTATASPGVNNNDKCTGSSGSSNASFTLDNTGPVVTATLSPAPNSAGWNSSNVGITWAAADAGSGVASGPTPASDSQTTNTAGLPKTATATDRLGNIGNGSVTVKLDKAAPTITGSRSPAANANGWNATDVTVSFTCDDALSGIKSCPGSTTLSGNGANQSVTGTAVDVANNSLSATVGSINIDKAAPTLSGAPTTSPNAASWYKSNVTIAWTCGDTLSGVVSCPSNSTIGSEGSGLTAATSVSDKAGNTTSATSSPAVNIDKTAPNTTVTAPSAWNKTDVTLSLVPSDALSGVASTSYALDGGAQQAGTSVSVASEGNHTLQFWSADKAGNVEPTRSVTFAIDKTSPTISHSQSPAANANGWNNANVTVTFTCSDALSGIATCTGPQSVTAEGRNQAVTGTATDNAGNTASDPATVSIDKTPPTAGITLNRAANGDGWYRDDVTATFSCGDSLSGIDTCPAAVTLSEGADQSVSGTARDAAGNTAGASKTGINVDETAPVVTGAATTDPNSSGWYAGDVTVHWTCSDALSGLGTTCPADSRITGEGGNLGAAVSVSDKAGNIGTAVVTGIRIDRTAPSTVAAAPSGWQNAEVAVALTGTDNLSGIDTTYYVVDGGAQKTGTSVVLGTDGTHTVEYWSVDRAGNTEDHKSVTVRIDTALPTITSSQSPEANANGWNNSPVTVSFACADQAALSGVGSCSAPTTVSAAGWAHTVIGHVADNAGNAGSTTATVNIDMTPPTIIVGPDRPANGAGWYSDDVTVSSQCDDALSGIDSCSAPRTLHQGSNQSYTGTATDAAGNSASAAQTGINIDATAPTLSAAPTTAPNADGWYSGNVTLAWACDDQPGLSGIDGRCPADSLLDTEGTDQTVTASVADLAGNTTSASSEPIKIDKTAPTTELSAPTGWVNDDVYVTLSAFDALSTVKATYYAINGSQVQTGTSIPLTEDGTYDLEYWSVDHAGNVEAANQATVKIDKTAPHITHDQAPARNANGWNKATVTVSFTCTDDLSQVKTCTDPVQVASEGKDQAVTGTAVDNAGNTSSDTAAVSIDKTAPTISGSRAPAANAGGWNDSPVSVHFDCADDAGGSGVADCTPDTTLGEGDSQSADGTVTDGAGNEAAATVSDVRVDLHAPTLDGTPTTPANAAGWYSGDVTIGWSCDDNLSGVPACPHDSTITGEGDTLSVTRSVADRADNTTTARSTVVRIDRTPPVTAADGPNAWQNAPATISFAPVDALSGVAGTYFAVDGGTAHAGTTWTVSTEGVHTVDYWSVDRAGNVEATHSMIVRIDLTNPTIEHSVTPAPNARGWNHTVPVTVRFSCADEPGGSGLADCTPESQITSDGESQPVLGRATDAAGNLTLDLVPLRVDTVKPTISAAAEREPNRNGWYAGDVTVAFTCADTLSGITFCPGPQTIGEGSDQSAAGTTADTADNTATASVNHINVDETAPTLSGALTGSPNADGWYNHDVVVQWTAADGQSGIDGSSPADSTISTEGVNVSAAASASDRAGNVTAAASPAVKLDKTAPDTTISAPSAWVSHAVTITLTPKDDLSGVKATHFRLDGGTVQDGESLSIGSEGVHDLEFWSVDKAGNVEQHKSVQVFIDATAPTIKGSSSPAANGQGWNNTSVRVTFSCSDAGSGVASCGPDGSVTAEGGDHAVTGTASDHAGNTGSDTVLVSIDKTAPSLTASPDRPANATDWYDAPVTVSYTCADQVGLSGVRSCPAARVLGEGANRSVTGTAVDEADNTSAPAGVTGINVDTTAPDLSGAATSSPNSNGWYAGDVTVNWTCGDQLSGIDGACPNDDVLTGEGRNLAATASVTDKAGNVASGTVAGIKVDRTSPLTTASSASGWHSAPVTVTFTSTDNLSGVAGTRFTVDGGAEQSGTSVTVEDTGIHPVAFYSIDKAGNAETPKSVTVLIDRIAPTIAGSAAPASNAGGWNNGPVTVTFSCADAGGSGLSAACQQPTTLTADTAGTTVTATAMDGAGNTSTTSVGPVRIDTTPPPIAVTGVSNGAKYTLGGVPAASCTATDALSGLAGSCGVTISGGAAGGVGTFTYTATAKDKAGNTGTVTGTYAVAYGFGSVFFLQPINDTAHQIGLATSVFKAGQTVPVKFQLLNAAGQPVQAASAPVWENPAKGGTTSVAVNESLYSTPGDSSTTFRWDPTAQQYIYNWNTDKAQAGFYWRIGARLDDGTVQFVNIGLK